VGATVFRDWQTDGGKTQELNVEANSMKAGTAVSTNANGSKVSMWAEVFSSSVAPDLCGLLVWA
jgi:hypothetical protein